MARKNVSHLTGKYRFQYSFLMHFSIINTIKPASKQFMLRKFSNNTEIYLGINTSISV